MSPCMLEFVLIPYALCNSILLVGGPSQGSSKLRTIGEDLCQTPSLTLQKSRHLLLSMSILEEYSKSSSAAVGADWAVFFSSKKEGLRGNKKSKCRADIARAGVGMIDL